MHSFHQHDTNKKRIEKLKNAHQSGYGFTIGFIVCAVSAFIGWASYFHVDEVARSQGEVIASSRVQIIQSVDGGVLETLEVKEGDMVEPGQVLAKLDQRRSGASVAEVQVRLFALKAKAARLRAEVLNQDIVFSDDLKAFAAEFVELENALFTQRQLGLSEELRTLNTAYDLAFKELRLVESLNNKGDASGTELLRAQRGLNEADAKRVNTKNRFLEDAQLELSKVEDEIAQNEQVLARREQEQAAALFTARVSGIVKNISVTTVGGVLRTGEELMQIIPVDDELLIEAKITPADISRVRKGQKATIKFDPFDYTIFGGVNGTVVYVSPDTIKEETSKGEEIFYRVRIAPLSRPIVTTSGKELDILPGMTAQVDIRSGSRPLMEYLLKPLRKTLTESLGER